MPQETAREAFDASSSAAQLLRIGDVTSDSCGSRYMQALVVALAGAGRALCHGGGAARCSMPSSRTLEEARRRA